MQSSQPSPRFPVRYANFLLLCLLLAVGVLKADAQSARQHRNQIPFSNPAGGPLLLDASFPFQGPAVPAVIVVHGGGWEAGDRRTYVNPLLSLLEASPYAWFSVDYRLAPAHPYPAAVDDVTEAVEWISANAAEFYVDPRRLFLVGESSGGHLVSLVGAKLPRQLPGNGRLAGVVPFYGIHDFETWFAPEGKVKRNAGLFLSATSLDDASRPRIRQASPVHFVARDMPPYLMIHGEKDPGVPLSQSQQMCHAMNKAGARCELFVLPGAGHGMENWESVPAFHAWKRPFLDWIAARVQELR